MDTRAKEEMITNDRQGQDKEPEPRGSEQEKESKEENDQQAKEGPQLDKPTQVTIPENEVHKKRVD